MEFKPGDKFGPYNIVSAIGKSGKGQAWKDGEGLFGDLTAQLMAWLLRGTGVFLVIDFGLVVPFLSPNKIAAGLLSVVSAIGMFAIPYFLLKRGRAVLSSRVCISTGATIGTIMALLGRGGVNNVGSTFQLAATALAFTILGPRWGLWIGALSLTADLANAVAESLGHPLPIFINYAPLSTWVTVAVIFVIVLFPLYGAFRVLRHQVIRRDQLNRLYALLSECGQAVIKAETEAALFSEVCRVAAGLGGFRVAVVGMIDLATDSITTVAASGEDVESLIGFKLNSLVAPPAPGPVWRSIHEQRAVVTNDYLNDPTTAPWRAEAVRRGIRSTISLPLWRGDRVIGALILYAGELNFFNEDEVGLATKVAATVSHKLDSIKQERRRRLLEKALESSDECVAISDPESRFLYVNGAFQRTYGYSEQELVGQSTAIVRSPVDPPESLTTRISALRSGSWRGQLLVRTKDGRDVPMTLSASGVFGDQGELIAMIGLTHDITEQIRDAEVRASLEAQLVKAQKLELAELRETQRLARLGSWSWDIASNTVHWSEQLYRSVGLDPSDPAPNYEGQARFYTEESWVLLTSAVEAAMIYGTPYRLELKMNLRKPLPEWITARGEAVFDANGKISGLRGSAQDITERKNLELQLAQAQRMESIGRLAGGVAHDFNNMLTVIMGYAALIKPDIASDAKQLKYVSEIEKAGERAKQLTQKLLGFSRQQIIAPVPSNLNDLLHDLMEPLGRLIGEDIELTFFPGKDLWTVLADHSQVNQILLNLVVNARHAMPSGGKLTIETENLRISEEYCQTHPEARPAEFVVVSVSDTGEGIAREVLPRVFEPFFTTKEQGHGTGLGLSMVYGIAKQNGGFVNVYSEPGTGSTFRIYLPQIAGAPKAENGLGAETAAKTGSGTVLVVEDDDLVRELVMASLKSIGYSPLAATSPAAAIELCNSAAGSRIDLLLTDVVMPGMNGMELRDRICAVLPGMRVLFMSGYTSNVIVKHGILKRGVHFIQKPFMAEELARRIEEVLA